MARGASSNVGAEDWIASYNAVMAPGGPVESKKAGPGCCSICCTLFSIFAALFLFVLASAMKNHYPYMHVHGASTGVAVSARRRDETRAWRALVFTRAHGTRRLERPAGRRPLGTTAASSITTACCHFIPFLAALAGDMNMMSKGVTYAGLAYLAFALLSMVFWIKGIMQLRSPVASASYGQVQ